MKDKRLEFYGLLDFYPNKENLKIIYNELSIDEKSIYKMYVYSLPFMDDNTKDLIWEFLNGWEECIFDLAKEYRIIKEKVERRKKIEVCNTEEIA